MKQVYVVQHSRSVGEEDQDTKLIGVYTSEQRAQEAAARARILPGFRDTPDAFFIDRYILDEDYWAEGFMSEP
jgi:hypothetical protein